MVVVAIVGIVVVRVAIVVGVSIMAVAIVEVVAIVLARISYLLQNQDFGRRK